MNKKIAYFLICVVCLVAFTGIALAQISSAYDIRWSRFASGGGERQSASYLTQDIIGQWVYGNPTSANYEIVSEFFDPDFPFVSYLPIIARQ